MFMQLAENYLLAAEAMMKDSKPDLAAYYLNTWNDRFPIPQGIIDSNTGAEMEQNPGYN